MDSKKKGDKPITAYFAKDRKKKTVYTKSPIITDETLLPGNSKKYKTVGDVKNAKDKAASLIITKMVPGAVRDHLTKWVFETKYLPKIRGNLTDRIRTLNNTSSYNHIVSHCFDGINPFENITKIPILGKYFVKLVSQLHKVNASETGTFIDFLMRRIICEIKQEEFSDMRANRYTSIDEIEIQPDTDPDHICKSGCKTLITQGIIYRKAGEPMPEPTECDLPLCQNMCYLKTKDTKNYPTTDILTEIYITSCCHAEAFGGCPTQTGLDQMIDTIHMIPAHQLVDPLVRLCTAMIANGTKILLNPAIGSAKFGIPADCDLVVDDVLFDIKCTSKENDIWEILQLLGYSALLLNNESFKMRINNVCILNILKGECKIYDIRNFTDENLTDYLHLLMPRYDPEKVIIKREFDPTIVQKPSFVSTYVSEYVIELAEAARNDHGEYYDVDGDPFDPLNMANWDGDQQIGFRD